MRELSFFGCEDFFSHAQFNTNSTREPFAFHVCCGERPSNCLFTPPLHANKGNVLRRRGTVQAQSTSFSRHTVTQPGAGGSKSLTDAQRGAPPCAHTPLGELHADRYAHRQPQCTQLAAPVFDETQRREIPQPVAG